MTLVSSACTTADFHREKSLEHFAKSALFEFCDQEVQIKECIVVNEHLADLTPEIVHFKNTQKADSLVVFDMQYFFPHSVIRYEKDGNESAVSTGIWLGNKEKLMASFLEEGNFSE